jgi:hypothetical protein
MANFPKIYEINTAVYLTRLSKQLDTQITLDNIPDSEIERLVELGFNSVWLMGMWNRSPLAIEINKSDPGFMSMLSRVIPDFKNEDLIGSAYSIKEYEVNSSFGGEAALIAFRQRLNEHGLSLILDFVPNHVGLDYVSEDNKDLFILGNETELEESPDYYYKSLYGIYAKGRDPTFPPWSDVLQLNAFSDADRQWSIATIKQIAKLCDGVRCDMAMLLLNEVFENTWGDKVGKPPETEYWHDVIETIKTESPEFIFIAEAYWDMQKELNSLGFDYCYDKSLLDFLAQGNNVGLEKHLESTVEYRSKLLSFIENHDEQRSAAYLDEDKILAAACIVLTLPGANLVYDGQLEGYKLNPPVQVGRVPVEPINVTLKNKYYLILGIIKKWGLDNLTWQRLNTKNEFVLAWLWQNQDSSRIVVINYSADTTKLEIDLNQSGLLQSELTDELSSTSINLDNNYTLKLELEQWQVMFLS